MFILFTIFAHSIYRIILQQRKQQLKNGKIVNNEIYVNFDDFIAASSPINSPVKQNNGKKDLLISNFNYLMDNDEDIDQQQAAVSIKHQQQNIIYTNSVQNLFQFGQQQQQPISAAIDEAEDEILRNLLIKLKKFSNKLNKSNNNVKSIKIKKRKNKLRLNKHKYVGKNKKMVIKTNANTMKKKCEKIRLTTTTTHHTFEKVNNTESVTVEVAKPMYKHSTKIDKLLNDSRGIGKYMVDYDISGLLSTSTSSSSVFDLSVNKSSTITKYFDNSFDCRELQFQFDQFENQLLLATDDDNDYEQPQQHLLLEDNEIELSFNDTTLNNQTLIKSTCSSGYLSDD